MMKSKIDEKDIRRVSLRYMFGGQLGWNYERMMNVAYVRAMYPVLKKLYGHNPQQFKEVLKNELQFFNTSPFLTAIILGLDLSLQNQEGYEAKDVVVATKTSLMGPFAAVGDSLFGAVIPTIFGSIAAYMGLEKNPVGVIIWLLVAAAILWLRYFELPIAYREGTNLLNGMQNVLQNLTEAATLLGVLVVGGLIPNVVKVVVPFVLVIGKKRLEIQTEVLDKLIPSLIPIVLVALAYWLLGRKGMNSTRVIWIFLVLSIVLSALKVLAVG
ncbi:PTS system mannose/fructose/sorbose family transporter subunit IID [Streptococcus hyovaginalis]|uniref:PTS system mannose/fructose/sorbose family transporter subunit IID n=1 Tax=Streptococcus hyovaginalis TaxID=149015 RepID=UPI0004A4DC99|nr:PTS system mannose/fructose/sorbose family transporter subunit IID [Streptococcus hyovaginalis]